LEAKSSLLLRLCFVYISRTASQLAELYNEDSASASTDHKLWLQAASQFQLNTLHDATSTGAGTRSMITAAKAK
jgi:hypothetical protein